MLYRFAQNIRYYQRFIVVLLFLIPLCSLGQIEHMKFMGIPINGNIANFKQRIIKKGFKYDSYNAERNPVGCMIFSGVFYGRESILYVYYNDKNQTVYRVKVLFLTNSNNVTNNLFEELEKSLDSKYPNYYKIEKDFEGRRTLHYLKGPNIGEIHMFRAYMMDNLSLFVDYYDYQNSEKNDKSKSDDL